MPLLLCYTRLETKGAKLMRKIDSNEAKQLIQSKQAGWYAVWANPPILHPNQTVVEFRDNCYLVGKDLFEIEPVGQIIMINGVPKQGFAICSYSPELTVLLKAEIERHKANAKTSPGYFTKDIDSKVQ